MMKSSSNIKFAILPEEFKKRLEKDLNNVVSVLPDYLKIKGKKITDHMNTSNKKEFLEEYVMGFCQESYFQAFQKIYSQAPTKFQMEEIDNIIARRKFQLQQGIKAFMEEKNS